MKTKVYYQIRIMGSTGQLHKNMKTSSIAHAREVGLKFASKYQDAVAHIYVGDEVHPVLKIRGLK